ncbi:hypothetical protein OOZ63_04370 [Paucibacter sp. PLA-PC-4]|uniref:hypothetical protein n=1 Tax=Paucibacter sp. PLA-PC-4 TaxID=2993655 RepID=UPI002248E1D6|nr:hypothetical protein [Paucibacter sp. PLA-PC-4]MCX2861070.1 hypothetical protein [Paucibacter sp. PLA-PC-4]
MRSLVFVTAAATLAAFQWPSVGAVSFAAGLWTALAVGCHDPSRFTALFLPQCVTAGSSHPVAQCAMTQAADRVF